MSVIHAVVICIFVWRFCSQIGSYLLPREVQEKSFYCNEKTEPTEMTFKCTAELHNNVITTNAVV